MIFFVHYGKYQYKAWGGDINGGHGTQLAHNPSLITLPIQYLTSHQLQCQFDSRVYCQGWCRQTLRLHLTLTAYHHKTHLGHPGWPAIPWVLSVCYPQPQLSTTYQENLSSGPIYEISYDLLIVTISGGKSHKFNCKVVFNVYWYILDKWSCNSYIIQWDGVVCVCLI